MDIIGAREVTLNEQSRSENVFLIIIFRLVLSVLLVIIISIGAYLFITPPEQRLVVIAFSIILISHGLKVNFFFQGIERMEYIALFRILSPVLIFCGVLVFVHGKEDIILAALIYSFSNLAVSIISLFIIHKLFLKFRIEINIERLKKLIFDAAPLVVSGFMIAVYYNLDIVMLRYLKTEFEVGIYTAAYKIFLVFIIPFALIFQSYQPKLTRFISNKTKVSLSVIKSYSVLMFTAAVTGGTMCFFLSNWIVLTLYSTEYIPAAGPLNILAMNILLVGTNIFFGNPLTIWEKQKLYTIAVTFGALSNIVLNFLLIPKYSYIGAAFATLISEVVVFIGVVIIFNKTISGLVPK